MPTDAAISQYIVRYVRPADIPAVRAMQERSMRVLGGDFYTVGEITNFLTLFGTMDDAVIEEGHYFVAEDDRGAILGSGGWTRSSPRYHHPIAETEAPAGMATVRSVFVDPAVTRRGVASAIMVRTERDARKHGVDMLHLTAMLSGFALYQALGYRIEEKTELRFPDQSSLRCIRMQKTLKGPRTKAA